MTAWDVIVIGAGPAGLSAATLLAEQGARAILVDEQPAPGGQIYRNIEQVQHNQELSRILGPDYTHGAALAARFRASGATYAPGTAVWNITPEREVWATRAGQSEKLLASAVILATGAMERPVPVPGWTLPGVMTAGAVQILLKSSALVERDGLVLAGCGPLLYLLAGQLLAAGVRPAAVLDTAARADEWEALRHLPASFGTEARRTLRKGLALKAALRRARLPVYRRVTDIRIEGTSQAEAVSFRSHRRPGRVAARLVALHEGVIPAQQITRALGCAHEWDATQHCFRPVLDSWGNSSLPGILVAGDAGGIAGARAAEHAGRLAAWEALRQTGRLTAGARDLAAAADRAALAAHRAVRPLLDRMYPPRTEILRPADDVVVCRCEEVTAGQIRAVARRGCQGPNQAKAFLRAGMGACQGRMCGPTVSELFAEAQDRNAASVGYYRIRPPLKPVTVGELAGLKTE